MGSDVVELGAMARMGDTGYCATCSSPIPYGWVFCNNACKEAYGMSKVSGVPRLVLVTGMSGSGKTYIAENLASLYPEDFEVVVSTTTRPMRKGEVHGKHYHFEPEMQPSDFIQYTKFGDYHYGIRSTDIQKVFDGGKVALLVISPDGIDQIYQRLQDVVNLQVLMCDTSLIIASRRMRDRGDTFDGFLARLQDMLCFPEDMHYLSRRWGIGDTSITVNTNMDVSEETFPKIRTLLLE